MIVAGLTGSIAMGKTETARLFAALGVPVFDADAEVHHLYAKNGEAVRAIGAQFPQAVIDGAIERQRLAELVLKDPEAVKMLESIVHPLVRKAENEFTRRCRAENRPLAVLDIPLLFETGRQHDVDRIIVVSAPADVQRSRALARPGMTPEKFEAIAARQVPDGEKRRQAHFIVDSSQGIDQALAQVKAIVAMLMQQAGAI
ncbi:MAG: dephospho-CoA kinase [Hyphomicrobiales bacterium]